MTLRDNDASSGVIGSKLDKQTFTNQFKSH